MIRRLADLSRYVSFVHYTIRRQIGDFAAIVGRSHCIVDVGSGETVPYRDLFNYGDGVYVSVDQFERADVQADAEILPLASEQADLILCTEVLEHLPEPQHALVEMNRVSAPNGFLVLTVPLVWGEHHGVDYHRWTEAGLRKMLQRAGFEILILKRRGGIFSAVGCLITRIPNQVFGQLKDQRCWLVKAIYVFCWLLTIPIPWLLALLDPIDRTRAFTAGYSVLCQKKRLDA